MEIYHSVSFTLSDERASLLDRAFKGMLKQELGARLQDRIDPLGSEAAEKLESMFDEGLLDVLQLENYRRDGERFQLEIMTGGGGDEFIIEFLELLALCGAEHLAARLEGDEYAHAYWFEDGEVKDRPVTEEE